MYLLQNFINVQIIIMRIHNNATLYHQWLFVLFFITALFSCKKSVEHIGIVGLCPIVVLTDPMDLAVDVAVNKVITITFNAPMNAASINNTTVFVKQNSSASFLAGIVAATGNEAVYTFTPDVPLLPFKNYTVTVSKEATNKFRTKMVADYNFSFTTIPQLSLNALPLNGGTTQGAGVYAQGAKVTVVAAPAAGFVFTNWTDSVGLQVVSNSPNFINTITGNHTLIANFRPVIAGNFAVNLSSIPAAGGTTTGSGSYAPGASVLFTATANPGYSFVNWTENGTIRSLSPTFQITNLSSNKNYVAHFSVVALSQLTLALSANPNAGGTTSGFGTYIAGASVTAIATPSIGYTFLNWTDVTTGAIVSTSANYTFVLNNSRTLVANFEINTYTINTTSLNGSIVNDPSQSNYNYGTNVLLTATPNVGYTFTSWSGDVTDTINPISVYMISNKNITANFTAIPAGTFALNIAAVNGTVLKAPSLTAYTNGTNVEMTATPNAGYTFTSWTGDATGTSNPLTVTMNTNKNITANFTAIPINTYTLNVTAVNGLTTKTPDQLTYNSGSMVQVQATALAGYTFSSWSGDATGNNNPLSVVMNANKNITANFTAIPPPVNLGSIANFGAYGGNAGITNQGLHTMINNGGIGTTAASTLITGFHDGLSGDVYTETPLNVGNATGGIYTAPPAPGTATSFTTASNALSDATIAYNSISPASKPGGTDPGAGELGGLTLAPGIYKSASGTFKITNLDLVLDAQGDPNAVWIFQTAAGLTVGTPAGAKSIIMIGGGLAKNVFWYVGSTAVINYAGGGTMVGTIIANSGVTLSSPASSTTTTAQTILNGRAISLISSVTMVNTIINNQ
jgi:uncharacterized repeat protein (TIGR02543 family)